MLQVSVSKDLDLIAASTAANQVHLFNLRDGRFVQVIDVSQFVEKPFTDDKVPKTNYRITQLVTTWTGYLIIAVTSLHTSLPNYLFCFDINGYLLYKRTDVRRIHTMCTSKDSKWLFCASAHNICIFTLPDLRLNTVLSSSEVQIDSICVGAFRGKVIRHLYQIVQSLAFFVLCVYQYSSIIILAYPSHIFLLQCDFS